MATIQFRRQLKYAHSKPEALNYIMNKLTMASGEPLMCTYKNPNGKWGSFQVICLFEKGIHRSKTTLFDNEYDSYFDESEILTRNVLKILDGEWESI